MDLGFPELTRRVTLTKRLWLLGRFRVPEKTGSLEAPLPCALCISLCFPWELVPEATLALCVRTAGNEVHETRRCVGAVHHPGSGDGEAGQVP